MADWDEASPQLYRNLVAVFGFARDDARRRKTPSLEMARAWQKQIMRDLTIPHPSYLGCFRGEADLEHCEVLVGHLPGAEAARVADELAAFELKLQVAIAELDDAIPKAVTSTDQLSAVIEVCAWAHAEWVRIHPFANGNGRTARLWANFIAMRYDLPPFVALRPRPRDDYSKASAAAMDGDWKPTEQVFLALLRQALGR